VIKHTTTYHAVKGTPILLKNGLIVDGTGKKGWIGNLLIRGNRIEKITERDIKIRCKTIDCTGKVIAPGFIDMHSHNDWVLPSKGKTELKIPFTLQGITTFVGGNCGFSAAGFKKDSQHMALIRNLFKDAYDDIYWKSVTDYFNYLDKTGITHNLILLAAHGTTRISMRGYASSPLVKEEMKEMLSLLEEAMDQGAQGVSLGLGYEPGIYAPMEELGEIARLVKKKDKILTVHAKALSAISGAYPLKPFGKPHNLIALEELIELARCTGVKLQISHLIFVGKKTWNTFPKALSIIDKAISQGVDVKFDTYPYHCGASIINSLLPPWFLARIPRIFDNKTALKRLKIEFRLMEKFLGFGFADIQITCANHPELNEFNGMFLSDIARERGLSQVDNYIDFVRKSKGTARVLMHHYSSPDIIQGLMKHPAALFMTDAWVDLSGVQNPAAFGCFPRFLQIARETKVISLEEAVHKMTGANSERFNIRNRGILKEKLPADITLFNWDTIKDNTTISGTDAAPTGIEDVFINGMHVVKKEKINTALRPGQVILS
jgi:N-acyl-D-amino-acid deacylase